MRNRPDGFEIYLVNVKTISTILRKAEPYWLWPTVAPSILTKNWGGMGAIAPLLSPLY